MLQRMYWRCILAAMWTIAVPGLSPAAGEPAAASRDRPVIEFRRQVVPLLVRHCLDCHNDVDLKGGLDLTTEKSLRTGGHTGQAVAPGAPDESLLWMYVEADEMPAREEKLSAEEKRILREWIASGARWDGGPIDPLAYTTDRRAGYDWWSLQPVRDVQPPAVRQEHRVANDIDRFILAELEKHQLTLADEADSRTLVRRLYYDVIGLPPPPERIAEFQAEWQLESSLQAAQNRLKSELESSLQAVQNRLKPGLQRSPDPYARLVDELLDSPHYGERWARHWFDVIRYGESQGFERNYLWPSAWRYRDWVILALNDDLPYDEFIRQQFAGDVLSPGDPRGVIATGGLTCGPWDMASALNGSDTMRRMAREVELEEQVATLGQAFLGLTLHCARCHDHKFDPIPTAEYYGFAAAVAGVWQGSRETLPAAPSEGLIAKRSRLERKITDLREEMAVLDADVRVAVLQDVQTAAREQLGEVEKRLAKAKSDLTKFQEKVEQAQDDAERVRMQNRVLAAQRRIRHATIQLSGARDALARLERDLPALPYGRIVDRLPPEDRDAYRRLVFQVSQLEMRREMLAGGVTHAPVPREPGVVHVLARGDFRHPREPVAAGGVTAVSGPESDFGLAADAPEAERRRKLAEWIADPRNPLTPRVIVNRIWQYHFGRGLVETANDFGFNGGRPSHPQLLDWLAAEFIRSGWRLKHIHRLILNSSTYRQDSRTSNPRAEHVDSDNRLLWRMNPRRLEAEALRDAVLAVSGALNPQMGGPGYRDFTVTSIGIDEFFYPNPHVFDGEVNRRTIYRTWARSATEPLLAAMDCPDPSVTAPRRTVTTTPIQALALLNSPFMESCADRFAENLIRDCGDQPREQIRRAYRLVFGRAPHEMECSQASRFIERHGLDRFCLVLFNANEFLFID